MSKLIIAAISARGYAQAAVENGYEVVTLDIFADADTQRFSKQTFKLKMHENAVDKADFKRAFLQIDLEKIDGFLYGSLFDSAPDLLAWVAERVPLIGNEPDALNQAKDFSFFKLLDELKIMHPEVRIQAPEMNSDWLVKQIGGSGGMHIKPANQAREGGYSWNTYFQKRVAGTPISMLFVADGKSAKTIGYNRQFISPNAELPYRFAGAVSNVELQASIHKAFESAAQRLTSTLSLCGINSLDAILDGDELWVLELNPRLGATFHLYENLLPLHIQSCAGDMTSFSPQSNISKAQLILYADDEMEVPHDFDWPSWAADIPANEEDASGVKISIGIPICSVLAEADNIGVKHANEVQALVLQRADKLREMLKLKALND